MADAARPLFMPAPRPVSRVSAEDVAALSEAVAGFGFGRASSPPEPPVAASELAPEPPAARPRPARALKKAAAPEAKDVSALPGAPRPVPADDVFGKGLPLRLDVPEALWTDLKIKAAQRRVTVRWLVLEALEQAGYAVEANAIPLDGRRVR